MTNFLKVARRSVKHWYLILIVGILFIAMGIWVAKTPEDSYVALAWLFSISFLVAGIAEIVFSVSNRKYLEGWGWTFSLGIFNTVVGVVMVMHPEVSMASLPYFVGFTLMFRSVYAISASIELKSYGIMDWGNLLALGIFGLIASFILVAYPVFTGISLVVITAVAFIVTGIYAIYYAFKLRKLKKIASEIKDTLLEEYESIKAEVLEEIKKQAQAEKSY